MVPETKSCLDLLSDLQQKMWFHGGSGSFRCVTYNTAGALGLFVFVCFTVCHFTVLQSYPFLRTKVEKIT